MQQLNNLSDDADQLMSVTLADGSILSLEFIFRPAIGRWSLDVVHPAKTIRGINLCLYPNIMRPWKNLIPFGIALVAADGIDPIQATDFQSGRVAVYILSEEEVQQVESDIIAPLPAE